MNCRENEIWNIVKDFSLKHNLNRFDLYVFAYNHIEKLERLLLRTLSLLEIRAEIQKSIEYLILQK
ncbi:MAG: hypothetical protein ACFFDF_18700 [Candidatus Odinarchaeota archaeon]